MISLLISLTLFFACTAMDQYVVIHSHDHSDTIPAPIFHFLIQADAIDVVPTNDSSITFDPSLRSILSHSPAAKTLSRCSYPHCTARCLAGHNLISHQFEEHTHSINSRFRKCDFPLCDFKTIYVPVAQQKKMMWKHLREYH